MAATLTAIGIAFDAGAGDKALGGVFAACYVLGCLAAVLAVRQSGVFTAVIQPPLILFVAVPFAYFVFHGSTFTGIKDTLINCGYPLIERFPLMFFTSATVLVIGMVRWHLGAAARRVVATDAEPTNEPPDVAAAATALAGKPRRSTRNAEARAARAALADSDALDVDPLDDDAPRPSRRTPRTPATGSERSTGASAGRASRRSRHSRPPETEIIEPVQDRPRRRNTAPVDPPAEPRRRPRASEPRAREPRDRRPLPPLDRRSGALDRDRPERERPQRRERPDAYERPERSERPERPERRRPRSTDYEPYEPFEPPVTRTNGSGGTHHPISRVRYRGSEDDESRTEHRTKPRRPRHSAPDSWE